MKKNWMRALLVCAVFLLGIELFFRITEVFIPPKPVDYGLGFNDDSRVFVRHPSKQHYWVTNPNKTMTFRNQEFSEAKSPNHCRIVALGGSSVYRLDERLPSLERDLQERFKHKYDKIEIINAGARSYGSGRLMIVLREMLQFDPDIVLLYSGHNEFEDMEQLELSGLKYVPLMRLMSKSAAFRFCRDRITDGWVSVLEDERNRGILSRSRVWARRMGTRPLTPEQKDRIMRAYESNLSIMIDLCKESGVTLVMGTVPSNLYMYLSPVQRRTGCSKVHDRQEYERVMQMAQEQLKSAPERQQSSDIENGIIRKLSEEHGIPLADVEQAVIDREPHNIPGEEYFLDHCHLNKEGNSIWVDTYKKILIDVL